MAAGENFSTLDMTNIYGWEEEQSRYRRRKQKCELSLSLSLSQTKGEGEKIETKSLIFNSNEDLTCAHIVVKGKSGKSFLHFSLSFPLCVLA